MPWSQCFGSFQLIRKIKEHLKTLDGTCCTLPCMQGKEEASPRPLDSSCTHSLSLSPARLFRILLLRVGLEGGINLLSQSLYLRGVGQTLGI